jgi:hypothetical protein
MWKRLFLCFAIFALSAHTAAAQSTQWRQLFNGKNLIGWKHVGSGTMLVEDGLIKTQGGMGLLYWTGEKFGNCVLRIVYRTQYKNDNSGVFIRIPIEPREEWMPVYYGYEVQIYDAGDDYHRSGVLYSLTQALASPAKPPGEWNTMEITLDGPRTIVVLNGVKVTDYMEGQAVPERKSSSEPQRGPRPLRGYFGLQNHPRENQQDSQVYFKEVAAKPLAK